MADIIELDPLDNALDFLRSAVNELADRVSEENLKYGTLHLVSAVEILLKVRLSQEHWSLVFKDFGRKRNQSEADAFSTGDFVSVTHSECLRRLRDIAGIDVPVAIPGFEQLVRRRNQFMHFGVEVSAEEIQSNAAKVFSFCLSFIDEQLRDEQGQLPEAVHGAVEQLRPTLDAIDRLVDERLRELEPSLREADVVVECPMCRQPGLVLEDGPHCLFCLAVLDSDEAAELYVDEVLGKSEYMAMKDGSEFPLHWCPDCGTRTLVEGVEAHYWEVGNDPHSTWTPHWLCFNHGYPVPYHDYTPCSRCGTVTNTSDDAGIAVCESCYAHLMED